VRVAPFLWRGERGPPTGHAMFGPVSSRGLLGPHTRSLAAFPATSTVIREKGGRRKRLLRELQTCTAHRTTGRPPSDSRSSPAHSRESGDEFLQLFFITKTRPSARRSVFALFARLRCPLFAHFLPIFCQSTASPSGKSTQFHMATQLGA